MPLLRRSKPKPFQEEARTAHEQLIAAHDTIDYLQENFRQLELAMADEGWRRLGMEMDREFTRAGLDDLTRMSRAMYMSNPLIQRAVNVTSFYVWGQGVVISSGNEEIRQEIIEPLTDDVRNKREVYGLQARVLNEVDQMVDGNTYTPLFTTDDGEVQIRSIPADEIREIICKPGDGAEVWFYRRVWSERVLDKRTGIMTPTEQKECLYPDVHYRPQAQPGSIGGRDVRWDAPVLHMRTGGLKAMKFGVPETYAAIDWARAYKKFLEDWHTIVNSLAKFAFKHTTKAKKVAGTREKYRQTMGPGRGRSAEGVEADETEDGQTVGNVAVLPPGDDIAPIPKNGAMTSADDAKASRLMVASAMNVPDTMLSNDPAVGALATAKTLDRPTELGMRLRQGMRSEWDQTIMRHKIDMKIRASLLDGRSEKIDGLWYYTPSEDPELQVVFPPILEREAKDIVAALVSAATLDGKIQAGTIPAEVLSRELMSAVGIEDVQSALDQLDTQDKKALDNAVGSLQDLIAQAQSQQNGNTIPAEAIAEVLSTIRPNGDTE